MKCGGLAYRNKNHMFTCVQFWQIIVIHLISCQPTIQFHIHLKDLLNFQISNTWNVNWFWPIDLNPQKIVKDNNKILNTWYVNLRVYSFWPIDSNLQKIVKDKIDYLAYKLVPRYRYRGTRRWDDEILSTEQVKRS